MRGVGVGCGSWAQTDGTKHKGQKQQMLLKITILRCASRVMRIVQGFFFAPSPS